MDDHQFKEEENESVGELSTVCSHIVLKSYWETWHFMVCEWTCSCDHIMDKSLRQTLGAFDLVHSSHKGVPTKLLCGKLSTTVQAWIIWRFWFLQEISKTQNQHEEEFRAFSGVTRLCQQVGCVRNKLQFHIVLQKLKSFLLMQVFAWTVFPLSLFGIWW